MAPPSSDGQQQWRGAATAVTAADPVAPASQWHHQAPSRPLTPPMAGPSTQPPQRALPRPPSLVFDIELEERGEGPGGDVSGDAVCAALRRFLLPGSTGEYKLRNDVQHGLAQQQHLQQPSALERNQHLAAILTRLGYRVHIRTALGGGEGFECLRNLRHVFLAVMPPGAHATTNRFVVDLSFKEQFRIAKPTPRYQLLLECLPSTYVAPEAAVTPLVNFMCQEMALAFNSTGVVLPPWRQTHSMLSKWIPRKSLDEHVPRPTLSPATPGIAAAAPAAALHSAAVQALPVSSSSSTRRSMDVTTGQVVRGHWVMAGAQQQQQQQHQNQQDAEAGRPSVFANQQHVGGLFAVVAVATGPAVSDVGRAGALTHRLSSGPVKPMSCEPQRVMVGGNFSAIGFA